MYKVYIWTNNKNGKKYVGATKHSMEKRAGINGHHYQGSPRFYTAIQKYGLDNFTYEIVKDGLTKEQAAALEKELITSLDTTNESVGYNLQDGGFPMMDHDPAYRATKISKTLKAQRSNPSYRKLMSSRMKAVWDDPERKKEILAKRSLKTTSGRPRCAVFCETNGVLYDSYHAVYRDLKIGVAALSHALSESDKYVVKRRDTGTIYTFYKVKRAH